MGHTLPDRILMPFGKEYRVRVISDKQMKHWWGDIMGAWVKHRSTIYIRRGAPIEMVDTFFHELEHLFADWKDEVKQEWEVENGGTEG